MAISVTARTTTTYTEGEFNASYETGSWTVWRASHGYIGGAVSLTDTELREFIRFLGLIQKAQFGKLETLDQPYFSNHD